MRSQERRWLRQGVIGDILEDTQEDSERRQQGRNETKVF